MQTFIVDSLEFEFPDEWHVARYDEWSFYRNRFAGFLSAKGVDLLAISPNGTLFLIEAKDYRVHRRTKDKTINLADEVTQKVLDTLAAMLPCKLNGDEELEKVFSDRALRARGLRVVLHLEQPLKHSKIFPRIFDRANIVMKLRQRLKPVDAHPKVVEMADPGAVAWIVRTA